MRDDTKAMLERLRKNMAWPDDDLLLVIHAKQNQKEVIANFLNSIGFKDSDAVEVTPE